MTFLLEGKNSFFLSSRAVLIEEDRELAWAEKHVVSNPAHKWVLGKFVEADKANNNRQYWSLDHLQMSRPSIAHAPMNMLHYPRHIVGAFVATDMIYPTQEQAGDTNAYIEALAVFWKYYFPEELKVIESAHADGSLFYSMECVAKSLTCAGDQGCGQEFAYAGPTSETYCDHINKGPGIKQLNDPWFVGGALIVPPHRPGWANAQISDLAELTKQYQQEAEMAYEGVKSEASQLDPKEWEQLMAVIMQYMDQCDQNMDAMRERARDFNTQSRDKLAKSGAAMPDGSFPIVTPQDLRNAIHAIGRAKDPSAAKAHIKKRATALGLSNLIPAGW